MNNILILIVAVCLSLMTAIATKNVTATIMVFIISGLALKMLDEIDRMKQRSED